MFFPLPVELPAVSGGIGAPGESGVVGVVELIELAAASMDLLTSSPALPRTAMQPPIRRRPAPGPVVPLRPPDHAQDRAVLAVGRHRHRHLATRPELPAMQFDNYLPAPCLLNPEQVTEYPDHMELSTELREQIGDWSLWQAAASLEAA